MDIYINRNVGEFGAVDEILQNFALVVHRKTGGHQIPIFWCAIQPENRHICK